MGRGQDISPGEGRSAPALPAKRRGRPKKVGICPADDKCAGCKRGRGCERVKLAEPATSAPAESPKPRARRAPERYEEAFPAEIRDQRESDNEAVRKKLKPPPVTESPIVAWLTGAAVKQAIAKAARSLAEGKSDDVIAQVGSLVEENALLKSDNAVLRNEIATLAKRLDKVRAELDAIKRAVARGLNKEDFEFSSHRSIIDEIVGKGYGHTESGERLLRMHAQEVVELILKKAGEDVLKQIELAAAVKDRLTDVNPNKDLPVALAIVESVKSWLKEIKNKFKGRFPNDIRSLYQGVHQAVGLADAKCSDVGIAPVISVKWTTARLSSGTACTSMSRSARTTTIVA